MGPLEPGTDLEIRESDGVASMVDGPNPQEAIDYAARISTAITAHLKPGNGFDVIQGKKHVKAEGWQLIATMTGHTVEIEWSRIIPGLEHPTNGFHAWEARAIVRDQHGRLVAAGESMADPREGDPQPKADGGTSKGAPWARAEFSIRSMAQTRAMGRALSSRCRYVVVLAGFSAVPAEEMGGGESGQPGGAAAESAKPAADWVQRQAEAERRALALGLSPAEFFPTVGVSDPRKLGTAKVWEKVTAELATLETAKAAADEAEAKGEAVSGDVVDEGRDDPEQGTFDGTGTKPQDPQT